LWKIHLASLSPALVGGGLFCCLLLFPLCQVGGPDRFFQSGGELEKFNAHVCFSPFGLLATVRLLSGSLAVAAF